MDVVTPTRPVVPGLALAALAGRIALTLIDDGYHDTARRNAWQAVCDDRRRAEARTRIREMLSAAAREG